MTSPLSTNELLALINFVSELYIAQGHDNSFKHTDAWLAQTQFDRESVHSFFAVHGVRGDYDLFDCADPYRLFGPSAERLARMPLESAQLREMRTALEERLRHTRCANDLSLTTQWLQVRQLPIAPTLTALIAQNGCCDCEVVLNVQPEKIYPATSILRADPFTDPV